MIRNSWNVGKIQRMRKQCVPGLPSPRGRPGNEASIVPNAILNQILNACLWLTVYSDVLEPPERLLVVSEWYEDSVEKHIESGKTNE